MGVNAGLDRQAQIVEPEECEAVRKSPAKLAADLVVELPVEGGQSRAKCGHSRFQSMMIDRALRCRNRNMSNAAPELPDAVRHRGCSRNSRQRGPVRTVNIWSEIGRAHV